MALSRLQEIVKSFALYYLDPQSEIRKKPDDIYIDTSKSNSGITKIYTRNKALTLFTDNTLLGKEMYNIQVGECLGNNLRFGVQNDIQHEQWHKTKDEFEQDHAHILKSLADNTNVDMTQTEFNCIFNKIKEYEKSNQHCKDGLTHCLLTQKDTANIKNQYAAYFRQSQRSIRIDAAAEKLIVALEQKCITGAKAFTQSFLTTLLERYIKPWLIDHGMSKETWMIEAAKSTITLGLSASMVGTALDAIIRNALKPVLIKAGMAETIVDEILAGMGTIAAFTQNPFSLIEIGINGKAAAMGQSAAYGIIHALPKLRQEPIPESQADIAAASPDDSTINSTIRRRIT